MNSDMTNVLRHVAEYFSPTDIQRLDTPFDVPGLDFDTQVAPALRRLAADTYVTGLEVAEIDYPFVLTGLTEKGWDAAEAAGGSHDAAPGAPASLPLPPATSASGDEFHLALSFAGEQRDYVRQAAGSLRVRASATSLTRSNKSCCGVETRSRSSSASTLTPRSR